MSKSDFAVYIGRFQPVHKGHLKSIHEALEGAEKLIVVVGSSKSPRTFWKNPWTYDERVEMISSCLPDSIKDRVIFVGARDFYSLTNWLVAVQYQVSQITGPEATVKIYGHFKDDSSFYLKHFPHWELVALPNYWGYNSTDVREVFFAFNGDISSKEDMVEDSVKKYLKGFSKTTLYKELASEHKFITNYKKKWENSPHPPVFTTTDAVVIKSGHILLIKRGRNPGKGMLALPGGFLQQDKTILDSCLSELKEETNLSYNKDKLKLHLQEVHVFDHPNRDIRGRTITHAHYFKIDELTPLPEVKGGDDASHAFWMQINDLDSYEDQFFSDHYYIINYFLKGIGK